MKSPTVRQISSKLLIQLLDEPNLDAQLAALTGPEWKAVVSVVGLEDSGELLSLASDHQLLELLDEELWAPDAAGSETIDAERLATVLEVLGDSGIDELAHKLSAVSEDFLRLALGSLVTVWSSQFLARHADEDEHGQIEKKLESHLAEEIGEYLILSSTGLGWDVVVELLVSWNESHPALLDRLLSRLATASECEVQEPDELLNLLDGMHELREEAEAEREDRRAALGYVSFSDARAFLALPSIREPGQIDAISKAYFRRLESGKTARAAGSPRSRPLARLIKSQRPDGTALGERDSLIKLAMKLLENGQPEVHAKCVEELAFLTNVVVANSRSDDIAANPADSLREVTERIEVGSTARFTSDDPVDTLVDALTKWGPIGLFRKATD